jgi:hypothetical protein
MKRQPFSFPAFFMLSKPAGGGNNQNGKKPDKKKPAEVAG